MKALEALLVTVVPLAAYWVPAIVAWRRHVQNIGSVVVVNLFLGWTVIGWIVALAMAVRTRQPVRSHV